MFEAIIILLVVVAFVAIVAWRQTVANARYDEKVGVRTPYSGGRFRNPFYSYKNS